MTRPIGWEEAVTMAVPFLVAGAAVLWHMGTYAAELRESARNWASLGGNATP